MPQHSFRTIRNAAALVVAGLIGGACHKAKPESAPAPVAESHPLSGIVGNPIIVAPVQSMRVAPELGWTSLPRAAAVIASLDSAIADSLRTRVGNNEWVYSEGLSKAFANNPTYATDPRALAVNPLKAPRLKVADRLPEPIASQLRTMIALQDARLVLIPVELRMDRTPAGLGRPVVRLVLVDPRTSVIRWIGEVTGADTPSYTSAFIALIAERLADLFVAK